MSHGSAKPIKLRFPNATTGQRRSLPVIASCGVHGDGLVKKLALNEKACTMQDVYCILCEDWAFPGRRWGSVKTGPLRFLFHGNTLSASSLSRMTS